MSKFSVGDRVRVYNDSNSYTGTVLENPFSECGFLSIKPDKDRYNLQAHPKQCRKLKIKKYVHSSYQSDNNGVFFILTNNKQEKMLIEIGYTLNIECIEGIIYFLQEAIKG